MHVQHYPGRGNNGIRLQTITGNQPGPENIRIIIIRDQPGIDAIPVAGCSKSFCTGRPEQNVFAGYFAVAIVAFDIYNRIAITIRKAVFNSIRSKNIVNTIIPRYRDDDD